MSFRTDRPDVPVLLLYNLEIATAVLASWQAGGGSHRGAG